MAITTLTSPPGNSLQAAAAEGHSNIINLLLENKPPALVDTPGGHYGSALMAAICSGNVDTVWALLEEKAQPNIKSRTYGLPLEKAISMGQAFKEIVSLLLDNHAEADTDLSPKGAAVHILHKAAIHNMIDLAKYCLDKGCHIDMITTEGPSYPRRFGDFAHEMTPLGCACAEGHVEMVDFLLKRGAPYELDKPQSAPLWTAAYQGHARVVRQLLTHFEAAHGEDEEKVNQFLLKRPHPRSGHPILFAAASSGKPEAVRVLLNHGAKYEANWFNATPLLATATFRCPEVTELLLKYYEDGKIDVQIDRQANNGRTALIEACANSCQRIEEMLLDAGANYTITDNGGATALHVSTIPDNDNLCRRLVKKAADEGHRQRFLDFINIRHRGSGRTALIDCVARKRPASFRMLLEHGANYELAGHAGNNPLLIAVQFGHNDMIETLFKRVKSDHETEPQKFHEYINRQNNDAKTAVYGACECNQPSTVRLLLEAGADYTITGKNDQTLLHAACWNGHKAVIKVVLDFLSKNASPDEASRFLNHRNSWAVTALFEACTKTPLDTIDMLLAHGSDYTIQRDSGVTVLHKVCFAGDLALAKNLLEFASKNATEQQFQDFLNQRNNDGKTALVDACQNGGSDVTGLLLDHGADYAISDKEGFTALHYCAWRNRGPTVDVLLDKTATDRTSSSASIKSKFSSFLNHASISNKRTALCDVACRNFTHLVTKLLEIKADWDCPDVDGRTPAHWACRNKNKEMYRILMAAAGLEAEGRKEDIKAEERKKIEERLHNRRDKDGESVLETALKKENSKKIAI